jgi:peptide/nickel transport system ATP-binding protein
MAAVPKLTGEGIAAGIAGRIPDYRTPPPGCRFHPRCPHVMAACRKEKPPYFDCGGGHKTACFLYRK